MYIIPQTFNLISHYFGELYGEEMEDALTERFKATIGRYGVDISVKKESDDLSKLTEQDMVLITYGNMVLEKEVPPLETLKKFCDEHIKGSINTVHFLPFFPYSSDEGFSVINYREINPKLGTWDNIQTFAKEYKLMFDLVLNHCSPESTWFKDYISGIAPEKNYFIEVDSKTDLSKVVRPRPWDLLTKFHTSQGEKSLWTTFSDDQIDLNWKTPDVFFEFLDIILNYISKGASILRLDAVAFLWKEIGTSCIHLPQTHKVIKLLRLILDLLETKTFLLTETNVPHRENISYFGKSDEADMVYQFAMPPLLLYGLLKQTSQPFQDWVIGLNRLPLNCTYFNFTASHDGIGLRPLENLMADEEVLWLVAEAKKRGSLINYRTLPDGKKKPYELNITYRDALAEENDLNSEKSIQRFLCSQAIMLSFKGIPGIYFHSLMGSHNWQEGVKAGENRDINRKKWDWQQLNSSLTDPHSEYHQVYERYLKLIEARKSSSAFHPQSVQTIVETDPYLLCLYRQSLEENQHVLCWYNFTDVEQTISTNTVLQVLGQEDLFDLISQKDFVLSKTENLSIEPFGFIWMTTR